MRNLLLITLAIFTLIGCGNLRDTEEDNNITKDNDTIITKTAPTLKALTITIDENIISGTKVGEITINDGGTPVTTIVLVGKGKSNFDVTKTGTITTSKDALLDYESTPFYNLKAIATNSIGSSSAVDIDISINDVNETKESNMTTTDSIYLEEINIPKYDPNDPTHVLITVDNGKWTSSVLNDPDYKHFYIEPGNYITKINLTASGTESERRTLSLYNGNNTHPASLSDDQVANILFHFDGADYWTIDRVANLDREVNPSMRFINGATYNIINRWHLRNFKYGVSIYPYCHYNTVQNSYINHAAESARSTIDAIALNIHTNRQKISETIGTKFINNDIRNATDGIQITRSIDLFSHDVNFEGTIIDNNRIWVDSEIYADKSGVLNTNGHYFYTENAIDLKAGSENQNNPVTITNNIMWGYNKIDLASSRAGKPFTSHYGVRNVKMNHNIIADSMTGLILNSAEDWEFKNNIIQNIYTTGSNFMLRMSQNKRVKVENNTLVNNTPFLEGWSLYIHELAVDDVFKNNIFINTPKAGGDITGHVFDNNWFYNSRETLPNMNTKKYTTAEKAKMGDYRFTYDRFTANPKQKILKGIVATKNSPHYNKAGSEISITYPPKSLKIYLNPIGSDENDGLSLDSPVLTLVKAQSIAKKLITTRDKNVEILIAPGTYYGQRVEWSFSMPYHTVAFKPLDKDASLPIFDGFNSSLNRNISLAIKITTRAKGEKTNIHIKNLVFQNYKGTISFSGNREKLQSSSSYNTIEGCYFKNTGIEAYSVIGIVNSSHNKIVDNHFENILNNPLLHAIYIAHNSSRNIISHNSFNNCDGDPIRVRDNSNYNIISDNTFTECGYQAAVSEWFCDKDAISYCTKTSAECPSHNNLVSNNNISSQGGPGSLDIYAPIYISTKKNSVTGCKPIEGYPRFIDKENLIF